MLKKFSSFVTAESKSRLYRWKVPYAKIDQIYQGNINRQIMKLP